MPAMELLCRILGFNPEKLSDNENRLLEATLFIKTCEELKKHYQNQFKNYFRLIKLNYEMENESMEDLFVRCILNDILSTGDYTLAGIANYTQIPGEIIDDLLFGLNTSPSAKLLRRIIELHRSVRPELYREMLKKIIASAI